jgi:hypothetical protein
MSKKKVYHFNYFLLVATYFLIAIKHQKNKFLYTLCCCCHIKKKLHKCSATIIQVAKQQYPIGTVPMLLNNFQRHWQVSLILTTTLLTHLHNLMHTYDLLSYVWQEVEIIPLRSPIEQDLHFCSKQANRYKMTTKITPVQ